MKKILIPVFVLCFCIGFVVTYFSDERVIKRTLKKAVRSAEQEQMRGSLGVIARKYRDPYGKDYEWIAGILHSLFQSVDDIRISYTITACAVEEEEATVSLIFKVSGTQEGKRTMIVGTVDESARAILEMEKIHGSWKIVSTAELLIPGVDVDDL